MEFKGLIVEDIDNLYQSVMMRVCNKSKISVDELNEIIKSQNDKIYEIFENAIKQVYSKGLLIPYKKFIKNTGDTIKILSKTHQHSFHYYFSFINTCYVCLERIRNKSPEEIEIKDTVILFLYGYLYRLADQIGIMLLNGYPDGAFRIWRSFYDYSIILMLHMKEYSNELANKYLEHDLRHVNKLAQSFNKHAGFWNFEKIEDSVITDHTAMTSELENKHGKDFLNEEYSWAKSIFNVKKVSFRDIEDYVEMTSYRPFYIWASTYIHSSFKSLRDFENEQQHLVLEYVLQQETDLTAFIDPLQLTIAVFYEVNIHFLKLYSDPSEYDINIMLFKELLFKLQETFSKA